MKKRSLIAVTICSVALLVLLTGCQTGENLTPPVPNQKITTDDAIQNTPKKTAVKTAQPNQIDTIESNAEDIMDNLAKNDWSAAKTRVDEMKTALAELKPILQSANVSASLTDGIETALAELEKQVANKQVYQAKVQANAVTKYIPDIADSYETVLPTDLGRLDYYGREIALNAENKDWTSADSNFDKGKEAWMRLKLQLNTRYQNDIDQFDQSVNSLRDSIDEKDQAAAIKEANRMLEFVDTLEKDFSNPVKNTWTSGYSS